MYQKDGFLNKSYWDNWFGIWEKIGDSYAYMWNDLYTRLLIIVKILKTEFGLNLNEQINYAIILEWTHLFKILCFIHLHIKPIFPTLEI